MLICLNAINPAGLLANPQNLPWTDGSGNRIGFTYFPNSPTNTLTKMVFNTADSNGSYANSYQAQPTFYIQWVGLAADGGGNVYKIDAMGYGGNSLSVAVVESTYEIGAGVLLHVLTLEVCHSNELFHSFFWRSSLSCWVWPWHPSAFAQTAAERGLHRRHQQQ